MKVGPFDVRTLDDCLDIVQDAFQSPMWQQLWQQLPVHEKTRLIGRLSNILAIAERRELEEAAMSRLMVKYICFRCKKSFSMPLEELKRGLTTLQRRSDRDQVLELWCDDCEESGITIHTAD